VVGKPLTLLYADPEVADSVRRTVIGRKGMIAEIRNRRKNGEIFTSLLSAATPRDPQDRMLGIVGASLDVSGRKAHPVLAKGAAYETTAQFKREDSTVFWARLAGRALQPGREGTGPARWASTRNGYADCSSTSRCTRSETSTFRARS
jgi:hypothetical protein